MMQVLRFRALLRHLKLPARLPKGRRTSGSPSRARATQSLARGVKAARRARKLILAMLVPALMWGKQTGTTAKPAGGQEPWGQKVVAIRLHTDANLSLDEFRERVVQQAGQPLDQEKVSQSLKALYSTGRFIDLSAVAHPASGGLELVFEGKARYFIGIVSVRGTPSSLDVQALVNATRLQLGHPLRKDSLPAALSRLKQSLAENGYYAAQVQVEVERNPGTQEANITFSLVPGRPAELTKIAIEGHAVFPAARLIQAAEWKAGHHLTAAKVEQGLYKLHRFYLKRGYLRSTALVRKRAYDPKRNTEELIVGMEAGPVIQVRVRGAEISKSDLRNLLPVYTDGVVDQPSLERGAKALQDYFQKKGYLQATVKAEPVARPDANHILATYSVQLGERGDFDGYEYRGNHHLTDNELDSALTQRTGGILFEHGVFSQEMLDENIRAIKSLYESRGYLKARVTPVMSGNLHVTLDIDEGPITLVRKLTLHGISPEFEKGIKPRLSNLPGLPFSPQYIEKDRLAILRYFSNRGYAHVQASGSYQDVKGEHAVDVSYSVDPGKKETVRQVLVIGDRHTRRGVIQRELTIAAGQPSNESDILQSQNNLYDLGIFNQVRIAPQDPGGDEASKTMVVQVEEARRWTLGYGGGIEVQRLGSNQPQGQIKASPSASMDVTRLNVGGRAQTATFRGRFSTLDRGASLSYFVAHLPDYKTLSVRFNALFDRSSDVLTFTAERAEVSVDLEKRYSSTTLLAAHYSFRHVLAYNLSNKIAPTDIPILSRPARIGMLGLSYINDHRDNPADPTHGSYSLADFGVAATQLGSQANFLRFSGQNSTYYHLGRHIILARDTRLGIESPYGGLQTIHTTVNGVPEVIQTHAIPLPERFFMGGSESHRGFSINQAGPRDPVEGFPIGGNALFLNTVELRIPFAQDRLGVVLFHDMGNVYSSGRKMRLFKVTQNSPTDFDYTVHALGLGFRYRTPVGPLRVDFAYDLNPPRFQVQSQTNGQTLTEVQRLSNFQFFIGIGQTF
jgi:outer membrane protein insertion porin family